MGLPPIRMSILPLALAFGVNAPHHVTGNSVGTDGDDDESSDDDLEESLADRKKRVMEEKEALPDDYTFEDMTPGSFAATVAGGEDKDKCWFTIQLPNG
eukprot:gene2241-2954_t